MITQSATHGQSFNLSGKFILHTRAAVARRKSGRRARTQTAGRASACPKPRQKKNLSL